MAQEKVEILDPEAPQRLMAGLSDVFSTQPLLSGACRAPDVVIVACAEQDFAGNAVTVTRPAKRADAFAEHALRLATEINLGAVEKVDAMVIGASEALVSAALIKARTESDPAAE